MQKNITFCAVCFLFGFVAAQASAAEDSLTTAVSSHVKNGYERKKLPDGSFKPEYYAISNGGYAAGIGHDPSSDEVPFPTVAGVVAQHLAAKNYFLAKDSKSADLLLVIQWGSTIPSNNSVYRNQLDQLSISMANMRNANDSGARGADGIQSDGGAAAGAAKSELVGSLLMMQMANNMRDKANEHNAILLGYIDTVNDMNDQRRFAGGGTSFDDLISDIENKRYYVIITAYDFKSAVQDKSKKVLWSTRVSIQAQGNRFNERLVTMIANAAQKFGQESGRLIRQYQRAPKINLGELKFLGVVSDESAKAKKAGQN